MDFTAPKQSIPDSVLPYPKGIYNRSKYVFWKVITPFHNYWRDLLLSLGFLKHEGRQNYLMGSLAPGKTVEDFLAFLVGHGWANHFIAWKDQDEIVSVRKLVDFERQYHLRIFSDGEVRGHFEYTPESHPRWHMKEVGQEAHREVFFKELGDWIVPATPASALFNGTIPVGTSAGSASSKN
jgi:hypothetical protein